MSVWKQRVEANIFLYLLGEGAHPTLSDDVLDIALQARRCCVSISCNKIYISLLGKQGSLGNEIRWSNERYESVEEVRAWKEVRT